MTSKDMTGTNPKSRMIYFSYLFKTISAVSRWTRFTRRWTAGLPKVLAMEKQTSEPRTALDQDSKVPQTRPKARALTPKMGKAGRKRIRDWATIRKAEIRGAQNP